MIVARNDTLDGIFRRLKLNLADLASLRALPRVRAALDSLRPGESLHFEHRDGSLYGLERRLNESEMLKVSRDPESGLQGRGRCRTPSRCACARCAASSTARCSRRSRPPAPMTRPPWRWPTSSAGTSTSCSTCVPGDAFVVTYPEIWREGVYVKDGPIQAAEFVNQGRDFKAVRYTDADGGSHYYTPDGRSLHKAFLRAPVEFTRVSSRFNSARHHPILNLIRAHKGVDYAAPMGTPVRAAGDGRVRFAGVKGGYGNVVEIEHSASVVTVYGHLSRFARGTHVGSHVTQGAGHRLRRHDRARHRAAPALRIPGERGVQEPPDGVAPRREPDRGTLAG